MVGIANGLAAYQKGMFIPFVLSSYNFYARTSLTSPTFTCAVSARRKLFRSTSEDFHAETLSRSFFQFWIYAAPAARMSALQGLRLIGIATHDSIGIGEDGPTHQPIAYVVTLHAYSRLPSDELSHRVASHRSTAASRISTSFARQMLRNAVCPLSHVELFSLPLLTFSYESGCMGGRSRSKGYTICLLSLSPTRPAPRWFRPLQSQTRRIPRLPQLYALIRLGST